MLLQLCEFSYVALPFGIATASTIRVGNMLGAGQPETAKRSGAPPHLPHMPVPATLWHRTISRVSVQMRRPFICTTDI